MRLFISRYEDVRRITGYNPETKEFDSAIEAPVTFIAETDEEHDEILEFVKKHVPETHESPIDEMDAESVEYQRMRHKEVFVE